MPDQEESEIGNDVDHLLRHLEAGVASQSDDFALQRLATHLAAAVSADMVLIGIVRGSGDVVRTAALWLNGAPAPNLEYRLKGTPCADVMAAVEPCIYASGIQELFPSDQILVDLNAQAYAGTPLVDSLGRVHGLMVVIHVKPVKHPDRLAAVLRVFASRAVSELERQLEDEHIYNRIIGKPD